MLDAIRNTQHIQSSEFSSQNTYNIVEGKKLEDGPFETCLRALRKITDSYSRRTNSRKIKIESIQMNNNIDLKDSSKKLIEASKGYLDFIHRISQGEIFDQSAQATTLLAPDCKKVLNGQIFTQNRDAFVSDLLSVYQNQGGWKVNPVDIIVSPPSNSVVLRLMIEMERAGTFTAIVILRYDSNYMITEINEVLNKVQGTYDFDGDDKARDASKGD